MNVSSVLILTHALPENRSLVLLPHLSWLRETVPGVDIHIIIGRDSPGGKKESWRNGDRPLREWWRDYGFTVRGDVIAVIEWDTLVTAPFPDLPADLDLAGAMVIPQHPLPLEQARFVMRHPRWKPENWLWWSHLPLMNLAPGEEGIGLVSFGCFLMRRKVLDSVTHPKWDEVYSKSIQNELRFPTIAKLSGHRVGKVDLPFIRHTDVKVGTRRGIYHSVDEPFEGTFED